MILIRALILIVIFVPFVKAQILFSEDSWNVHFNLKDIKRLQYYNDKIYCFGAKGFYYFDLIEKSINTSTFSEGFSGYSVSASTMTSENLILGYSSGQIDFISSNNILSIDLNNPDSKTIINSMIMRGHLLYVSTSSGLFIIDAEKKTIKEKYSNIGLGGENINIIETKFFQDSIYLVTTDLIYYANINSSNLLDYNLWETKNYYDDKILGSYILNNKIFFYSTKFIYSNNGELIYQADKNNIIKIKLIKNQPHLLIFDEENLNSTLGVLVDNESFQEIYKSNTDLIFDFDLIIDQIWLVGNNFSLYSLENNLFISPQNSPSINISIIAEEENIIYGFSDGKVISSIEENRWKNEKLESFNNITSIAYFNNNLFFGSKSMGIFDKKTNIIIDNNSNNSLLKPISSGEVNISDLKTEINNLWILNYGVNTPLLSLNNNLEWTVHDLGNTSPLFPVQLEFNDSETFWIRMDNLQSGGILLYDVSSEQTFKLSSSNNMLNSNNVNTISIDKKNKVWIGSDKGLIYFSSSKLDDIVNLESYLIPDDGNKNIFQDIQINSLLIDNSNNKWIGTENGLFVYDSEEKIIIKHFQKDNSPLISDTIYSMEMNEKGEIFILTSEGLMSLNTYNSSPKNNYDLVKIYPNPLLLKEHETLIFSGLLENNHIKITSLSGAEIITLEYRGGGLSWSLIGKNGKKILPGIYLVFIVSDDGTENFLSKILVI